ncbi:MAG TPA: hypothetical protein VFH13_07695, partial [Gemmatimonadaceae bacterium]|nr:hypothetical protein [Gemmatimonadaceae bacterium]
MIFTKPVREETHAAGTTPAHDEWRIWIPLAAVVFALIALVVIPMSRTRLAEPLNADLKSVIEPGR